MTQITVQVTVNLDSKNVWELWTNPKHIMNWNFASDDWECPYAKNDLRISGKFLFTMSAKDGSAKFDFEGTYSNMEKFKHIEYNIIDGRKVKIQFIPQQNATKIIETFEIEKTNTEERQRGGWQAILDNFKKYAEK